MFSILLRLKICCVFSLKSHHGGDFNEKTQYNIFNIKRKIKLNYPKSTAMGFFPRDSSTSSRQPW